MECFEKWVYKIEKEGPYAKIDRNLCTSWCEFSKSLNTFEKIMGFIYYSLSISITETMNLTYNFNLWHSG